MADGPAVIADTQAATVAAYNASMSQRDSQVADKVTMAQEIDAAAKQQVETLIVRHRKTNENQKDDYNYSGLARDLKKLNSEVVTNATFELLAPEQQIKLRTAMGLADTRPTINDMHKEALVTSLDSITGGTANFPSDTANGIIRFGEMVTAQNEGAYGRVPQPYTYRNEVAAEHAKDVQAVLSTGTVAVTPRIRVPGVLSRLRVTPAGISRIEAHLKSLALTAEENAPNAAMIERLKAGARTPQDLNFYRHELMEADLMKNGMADPRAAHLETLRRQGIEYKPGYEAELYHPDVIQQYSSHFNPAVIKRATGK